MKFGIDSDGNYGYIKAGADSVTPFSSGIYKFAYSYNRNSNVVASDNLNFTIDSTRKYTILPICASNAYTNSTLKIAKNGTKVLENTSIEENQIAW